MEKNIEKKFPPHENTPRVGDIEERIEGLLEDFGHGYFYYPSNDYLSVSTFRIKTKEGERYAITFPKEFSQPEKDALLNQQVMYIWMYEAKYVDGSAYAFIKIDHWGHKLRVLTGPYKGLEFREFISNRGGLHQSSSQMRPLTEK